MDIDISLDYGVTLLAALLVGTGFVLQQYAAEREPDSHFLSLRLMTDLIRTPRWLAGIGCMVLGYILAAWSIGHLELSFVEPLLATNLIFALVLAVPLSRRSVKLGEVAGAAVLCTGVALLSSSRSAKPLGESFGGVSHWPAAAAIAAIAFICVQAGRKRPSRTKAMLTGIGAGLIFGIQDALTRQTLQILQSNGISGMFTTWAPYALVGAAAIGIWLMQSAFNAGSLQVSLPGISAGEPLVGILLGIIVFGDRIQLTTSQLAIQAAGVATLIVGVIMVARAPALSQLRTWTPSSIPLSLPHGLPGLLSGRSGDEEPDNGQPDNGQPDNGQLENAEPSADSASPNEQSPNGKRPDTQLPNGQPSGTEARASLDHGRSAESA